MFITPLSKITQEEQKSPQGDFSCDLSFDIANIHIVYCSCFFHTPLWVAEAFVPDVFITVILSATLLFVTGTIKTIILIRYSSKARKI
ncbi:MAG: hypothetical protein IJV48_05640 [Ruminococcus sp.]|nr:hypothetical protein [Ruminococcus sp.]